jgi:hypothetical protein
LREMQADTRPYRFDEEFEQLVAEGIDPEQPDEHQFFVP